MSPLDPLHYRVHPMLWCRYRCRYRIYDCHDIQQHGTSCPLNRPKGESCHRHEYAEAVSLSVRSSSVPFTLKLLTRISSYQGHVGAALVLGGVDATGPHLFTIHPHGSTDKLPYVTMGSGSLAAMAVFEAQWKPNMTVCQLIPHLKSQLTQ